MRKLEAQKRQLCIHVPHGSRGMRHKICTYVICDGLHAVREADRVGDLASVRVLPGQCAVRQLPAVVYVHVNICNRHVVVRQQRYIGGRRSSAGPGRRRSGVAHSQPSPCPSTPWRPPLPSGPSPTGRRAETNHPVGAGCSRSCSMSAAAGRAQRVFTQRQAASAAPGGQAADQ